VGGRCLVLTHWVAHLHNLAGALQAMGCDPVVLRGGMGARTRAAALSRLQPQPGGSPLLVVATGPYVSEGFDCPALGTLFLAAPIRWKGRLVQYARRILRPYPGQETAEVHDYHDVGTGVLASTLAGRAPATPASGSPTLGGSPNTKREHPSQTEPCALGHPRLPGGWGTNCAAR
jgi:superfamily II DNA or RNA helicase